MVWLPIIAAIDRRRGADVAAVSIDMQANHSAAVAGCRAAHLVASPIAGAVSSGAELQALDFAAVAGCRAVHLVAVQEAAVGRGPWRRAVRTCRPTTLRPSLWFWLSG
ncbi:MAG: hypothetical protein NTY19_04300, partial [Planctomycetota bacterium]|nr:hypothetical protein [Planctomycetota bacterium]